MIDNLQIVIGIVGVIISLYVLMTKTINTKSCFDTMLISFIGLNWMFSTLNLGHISISSLVSHSVLLCLYILIIYLRYKGKENNICITLGLK